MLVGLVTAVSVVACTTTESPSEPEVAARVDSSDRPATTWSSQLPTTSTTEADGRPALTDGARFVVGGPFPDGSLVYLDADGSVLRYGGPKADTFVDTGWSAVCSGQGALVGIRDHRSLWIRDLRAGEARTVDLSEPLGDGYIVATSCRSPDGESLWVVVGHPSGDHVQMDLWEIAGDEHRFIADVSDQGGPVVHIVGDHIVVTHHHEEGERLTALNVTTGRVEVIGEVPAGTEFSLVSTNPSQSELIVGASAWNWGDPHSFVLRVDLDPWEVHHVVEFPDQEGGAAWVDDTHAILSFAYGGPDEPDVAGPDVSIVNADDFSPVGHVDEWPGVSSVLVDGALWGVTDGKVIRGDVKTGEVEIVTTLPAVTFGPLLVLEDS